MAKTRVFIVDDSALMRAFLSRVIDAQPDMEVGGMTADPTLAAGRIAALKPDVVTLDVEMPRMNGLEFLEKLMRTSPQRVVMVSSLTAHGAETTLRALELGAVDFIAKPQVLSGAELETYAEDVAEKVRSAAAAKLPVARRPPAFVAGRVKTGVVSGPLVDRIIVVGASTGGVEALLELLQPLPAGMPPILVAQHMPAGFTTSFAQRLDATCALNVVEASDGEPLRAGRVYIAPGGRHLAVVRGGGRLVTRLLDSPPVNRHRPSVDPLFRSAAQAAGRRCIGVMLTGMGADGADAMLELRRCGAYNIAQDERSCVVFGMPMQAIKVGAVDQVLPLGGIGRRLVELSSGQSRADPRVSIPPATA